jgi:hypothetical protein
LVPYPILISRSRLAIRYDVRTSGQQPTIEKAQVIENKQSRLQRLIDMFEHQADSYILCHKALENVPFASLTNYSQFNNVNMLDNSDLQISLQLSPLVLPVTDVYIFFVFWVEVLIIRYDKMVSHMMPTCAFAFAIKARDPGKDLPYLILDMCML